jgi:hypothetical protein
LFRPIALRVAIHLCACLAVTDELLSACGARHGSSSVAIAALRSAWVATAAESNKDVSGISAPSTELMKMIRLRYSSSSSSSSRSSNNSSSSICKYNSDSDNNYRKSLRDSTTTTTGTEVKRAPKRRDSGPSLSARILARRSAEAAAARPSVQEKEDSGPVSVAASWRRHRRSDGAEKARRGHSVEHRRPHAFQRRRQQRPSSVERGTTNKTSVRSSPPPLTDSEEKALTEAPTPDEPRLEDPGGVGDGGGRRVLPDRSSSSTFDATTGHESIHDSVLRAAAAAIDSRGVASMAKELPALSEERGVESEEGEGCDASATTDTESKQEATSIAAGAIEDSAPRGQLHSSASPMMLGETPFSPAVAAPTCVDTVRELEQRIRTQELYHNRCVVSLRGDLASANSRVRFLERELQELAAKYEQSEARRDALLVAMSEREVDHAIERSLHRSPSPGGAPAYYY